MKTSNKQNSSKEPTNRYDLRRVNTFQRNARGMNPGLKHPRQEQMKLYSLSSVGRLGRDTKPVIPSDRKDFQLRSDRPVTTWWTHLWGGLVRDPTGKHHNALRQAVWLYLYFLVAANWRTGMLFRRIPTIAAETGFNIRNINRWIKTLRERDYIKTTSTGRSLNISITKWRPISRKGRL